MKLINILVLLFFSTHAGLAQDFSSKIQKVYDFDMNELSSDEKKSKTIQIDSLYKQVKSDTTLYLPQLRKELSTSKNSFLIVDGSILLMQASKSVSDEVLILNCLKRCDLKYVSDKSFFKLTHYLSVHGYNTVELNLKILRDTTFSVFLENHFVTIGQSYAMLYTLLPLQKTYYLNDVMKLYQNEQSVYINKTILMVLWYSSTCEGDSLIRAASQDMSKPIKVREYATKIISVYPKDRHNKPGKYKRLIAQRNKLFDRPASDESIDALEEFVYKLMNYYTCE